MEAPCGADLALQRRWKHESTEELSENAGGDDRWIKGAEPCADAAAAQLLRAVQLVRLEYLSQYFHITVDYYNPNIYPEEEYHMRVQEQQRLIRELPAKYPIAFREGAYDKERFYEMARGLEEEKEGGERCFRCYELRLREAAETAKSLGMDYFTTTLSISPLKNAEKLNEIGDALAEEYGVAYLNSDFKKKNGYKRSVELSEQYGMYRQYYCGCVFSKRERDAQIAAKRRHREFDAVKHERTCGKRELHVE